MGPGHRVPTVRVPLNDKDSTANADERFKQVTGHHRGIIASTDTDPELRD